MPRQNIRIPLLKYPTENDMPHSIRTDIRIHETKRFETFLKINDLNNILVGHYKRYTNNNFLLSEECICYSYMNNDEDAKSPLLFMTLKFGNIENAFRKHQLGESVQ